MTGSTSDGRVAGQVAIPTGFHLHLEHRSNALLAPDVPVTAFAGDARRVTSVTKEYEIWQPVYRELRRHNFVSGQRC